MRRRIIGLLIVLALVVLLAVIAYVVQRTGARGQSAVERWAGAQLKAATDLHLNPRLEFASLDYQYPNLILLERVRLTTDDPERAADLDILEVEHLRLELAEIPQVGQPLRITNLVLTRPQLRFVRAPGDDAGLLGWSQLVRESDLEQPVEVEGQSLRLSDIFEIRTLELQDGLILYDARQPDVQPMTLDQINSTLLLEPAETGWYTLRTQLRRPEIFDLAIDGRYNIDEGLLQADSLALNLLLAPEQDRYLPPQLQQLRRDLQLTGQLNLQASLALSPSNWRELVLDAQLRMGQAQVMLGDRPLALDQLQARVTAQQGTLQLQQLEAQTMGGNLLLTGQLALADPMHMNLELRADRLQLSQVASALGGQRVGANYRGLLNAHVQYAAPVSQWNQAAAGRGSVFLRQGQIQQLPLLIEIARATRLLGNVLGQQRLQEDTADIEFTFQGDHILADPAKLRTNLLALDGGGRIYFDGRLDLAFRGGPVEKITSLLGQVGEQIGAITSRLTTYQVTGTVSEPKVSVKPLGGL